MRPLPSMVSDKTKGRKGEDAPHARDDLAPLFWARGSFETALDGPVAEPAVRDEHNEYSREESGDAPMHHHLSATCADRVDDPAALLGARDLGGIVSIGGKGRDSERVRTREEKTKNPP